MGNIHKAEVDFDAEGKTYTLRYSIDAICSLEEMTGKTFPVIAVEMADPAKISLTMLRQLMWAGLREHHADIDVKQAGELIGAAGGAVNVINLLTRAFGAAFPEPEKKSRPRRPDSRRQVGTGPASSATGAASALTRSNSGA